MKQSINGESAACMGIHNGTLVEKISLCNRDTPLHKKTQGQGNWQSVGNAFDRILAKNLPNKVGEAFLPELEV